MSLQNIFLYDFYIR